MTRTLPRHDLSRMHSSPTRAFAWLLWRRHRIAFTVWLAYTAVLAIVIQALHWTGYSSWEPLFTVPSITGLVVFVGSAGDPDADLLASGSPYPAHLRTRPVSTASLVLWPMLYGACASAFGWVVFATLIATPMGATLNLASTTAMIVAVFTTVQALVWSPFRLGWVRPVAIVTALVFIPMTLLLAGFAGIPSGLQTSVLVLLIVIAYASVWRGVGVARRGDDLAGPDARERRRNNPSISTPRRLPPFASAGTAQGWFDSRWNVMISIGAAAVATVMALVALSACTALLLPGIGEGLALLTLMNGASFVTGSGWITKNRTFTTFYATRPMTCASLVVSLLRSAAIATAWSWMVVLAIVGAYGGIFAAVGGYGFLGLPHLAPHAWFVLILGMLITTWKCRSGRLWNLSSGRRWISLADGLLTAMLWGPVCFFFMKAAQSDRNYTDFWTIICLGAALKLALLVLIALCLDRTKLVSRVALIRIIVSWVIATAALSFLTVACVPAGLASPMAVASAVIVLMPGVHTALLPLTIAWNRSR